MGGAAVHLEASDAITITGSSHLLHGGGVGVGFRAGAGAGAEALWLVSPEVTVTDKSTLRVFGSLSVDGGPVGGGSFAVKGGSAVAVDPSPASATSFVFNVETVRISGGGSLVVSGDGALAVAGRGEDRGSLVVGDEDDPARESVTLRGAFLDAAGGNDASSIRAGRLVVDRFARVSVTRDGVVRASLEGDGDAGRDARVQCSALSCPAYVFGPGTRTAMGLASNLANLVESRSRSSRTAEAPEQTAAPSPPVPCQIGVSTPFSLQLCHASTVEVTAGGVVASRATHAYAVDLVRVTGAGSSLDADGAGCRAGEGEGRGVGFASGAGGGGGYGGVGGDGFTPDREFAPNRTEDAPSGTNGTVSRGGSTYGDSAAPCAVSGAGSGGGAGAGAGYGGAGGGLVVLGTATRPLAGLIVGAGARISADGADGGDTDVDGADRDVAGGGGGGSGGTVLAFTRALDVDPTGRVAAAGGAGGASGGGGGGGGRVHLAWPERLPDVSIGASNNRTAPDGTLAAFGGASRGLGRPGGDGSVSSSPCPPGYSGALCHRCVAGTYKSERGVGACVPCAPPPRRAAFVDPPGPAGAVAPECPYACARENLRPSDCATQFEAAVAAVGGPASAAALVATSAVVVASAAAATARRARGTPTDAAGPRVRVDDGSARAAVFVDGAVNTRITPTTSPRRFSVRSRTLTLTRTMTAWTTTRATSPRRLCTACISTAPTTAAIRGVCPRAPAHGSTASPRGGVESSRARVRVGRAGELGRGGRSGRVGGGSGRVARRGEERFVRRRDAREMARRRRRGARDALPARGERVAMARTKTRREKSRAIGGSLRQAMFAIGAREGAAGRTRVRRVGGSNRRVVGFFRARRRGGGRRAGILGGRSARGTIAHARALRGRRNVRVAVAMGTRGPRSRGGGFTARVASYGDDGQRVGRRTQARASETARLSPRRPETLPRERNVAAEAKRRSWWTRWARRRR